MFYGILIISLIITLSAQAFVSMTYSKTKKIKNINNLTGCEVARQILDNNGLSNVKVVEEKKEKKTTKKETKKKESK